MKPMRRLRKRGTKRNSSRSMLPPPSTILYRGPITYPPHDETSVLLYDSYDVSFTTSTAVDCS
jgi:hypothetical protein